MIDVHVIQHPEQDRSANESRLIASLTSEPCVQTHVVEGIKNDIAAGRVTGFRAGSNDYVSFVDDDDDFEPGIFGICERALKADPDLSVVVTREKVDTKTSSRISAFTRSPGARLTPKDISHVHHLVVARRDVVEKYFKYLAGAKAFPEFTLWAAMLLDGVMFRQIDVVGYTWRMHDGGAKSLKIPATELTKSLINRCICWKPSRSYRLRQPK